MDQKQLAHLWANGRINPNVKKSATALFAEGNSIYSYGRHFKIARIVERDEVKARYFLRDVRGVVLFTSREYSSTTSKHKHHVWHAFDTVRYNVLKVDNVDAKTREEHLANVQKLEAAALDFKTKAARAITRFLEHEDTARQYYKMARVYSLAFGLKKSDARAAWKAEKVLWTKDERARFDEQLKRTAERVKKAKAERMKNGVASLVLWRKHEKHAPVGFHLFPPALRIARGQDRDEVETSHGARVPLEDARLFVGALRRGAARPGMSVGNFTLNDVNEKTVKIGCHVIEREEIEAFARSQGWAS